MGLSHSPQVVTNGLVFYYDMGNPQKSWKGAPTTNLLPQSTREHTGGVSSYFSGSINSNNTEKQFPSFKITTVNNSTLDGFITSSSGNLTNGVTYTWSADVWVPTGKTIQIGMRQITGGGRIGSSTLNIAGTDSWVRVSRTFTADTNTSGSIEGNEQNAVTDVYSFWIRNLQLEQQSFATPFVNGTRSNTQAIFDLVGNNTITANALTYNADNTFSFNGSSNLLTISNNTLFDTNAPTVDVWVKTNAVSQNGFWFEKGTVNSQYALFQEGANIVWRTKGVGVAYNSLTATSASYLSTSSWANVVGTYTSGNKVLYVNGVQVASNATTGNLDVNAGGQSIGVYGGFNGSRGYYYNGSIGIVKVYNKALTALEIQQNFSALRGRYGI